MGNFDFARRAESRADRRTVSSLKCAFVAAVALAACAARGGETNLLFGTNDVIAFEGRVEDSEALRVDLLAGPTNGSPAIHYFWIITNPVDTASVPIPDAFLTIRRDWYKAVDYYIRPDLGSYRPELRDAATAYATNAPPASAHTFEIEVLRNVAPTGILQETEFWIDGRYLETVSVTTAFHSVRLIFDGDTYAFPLGYDQPHSGRFRPLQVGHFSRPGAMTNGTLTIPTGTNTFSEVPFLVAHPSNSIDVGWARSVADDGLNQSYRDRYYSRSTFDGVPESIIFSVPNRQYTRAHVLCAVDWTAVDPEDKNGEWPVLTARLTRFCLTPGRGSAIADTVVDFPDLFAAGSVEMVGQVGYTPEGGSVTQTPLYRVEIPLALGRIQDLLTTDNRGMWSSLQRREGEWYWNAHQYLDFELTCVMKEPAPWLLEPYQQGHWTVPFEPNAVSAVSVFGVTLEESPVAMTCVATQLPAHVFYTNENPRVEIRLEETSGVSGSYALDWEFVDIEGALVEAAELVTTLGANQATNVTIPAPLDYGWYGARVALREQTGRTLVEHRTSLVVLPDDTRQAGQESPFGTWYPSPYHAFVTNVQPVGPLYQRAGLRHTTMAPGTAPEADLLGYDIYPSYIRFALSRTNQNDGLRLPTDEWMQRMATGIVESVAAYPSSDSAAVFHETPGPFTPGGWIYPPELAGATLAELGLEPSASEWSDFETNYWPKAQALCDYYRQNHPDVSIVFGNGGTLSLVSAFLRQSFNPTNFMDSFGIDYIGSEVPALTTMPEKLHEHGLQETWLTKRLFEIFGYTNAPLTAYFEWIGRSDQNLGRRTQAEWYARDCLHGLMYNFHTITAAAICDAASSYYHGWPAAPGGLCQRYPLLTPKPSYAAIATLTDTLDSAQYVGRLETGSRTLYALEFVSTAHNRRVYALWTLRGKRETLLRFSDDTTFTAVNMVGKRTPSATQQTGALLDVSTAPSYVVLNAMDVALLGVTPQEPRFPGETAPPGRVEIVCPMDDLWRWDISFTNGPPLQTHLYGSNDWAISFLEAPQGVSARRGNYRHLPYRTQQAMDVRIAVDGEYPGLSSVSCLEIVCQPTNAAPDLITEYAILRLADPLPLTNGFPAALGLWVKGNSGWGRVMWQFEEKGGGKWLSCGRPGTLSLDSLDPPGRISVTHDGWTFLTMGLPERLRRDTHAVSYLRPHWQFEGDAFVDYPIKLTGIVVEMPRNVAYLDEMLPVTDRRLRLKDLSVVYENEPTSVTQRCLTVVSTHNATDPTPGAHVHDDGTSLGCSVLSPDAAVNLTEYVCTGWALTGHADTNGYTSGTGDTVNIILTNDATLTWQWETQLGLIITTPGNGDVAPLSGWFALGTSVWATASPHPYYHLDAWTGTVASVTNPLKLFMDQTHEIAALFEPDLTSLGTPHWWLAAHGLTNLAWSLEELEDHDEDGLLTWEEWVSRTAPNYALSVLKISGCYATDGGEFVFGWDTMPERLYTVNAASNLSSSWTDVGERLGTEGESTEWYTNDTPQHRFFRITVGDP